MVIKLSFIYLLLLLFYLNKLNVMLRLSLLNMKI